MSEKMTRKSSRERDSNIVLDDEVECQTRNQEREIPQSRSDGAEEIASGVKDDRGNETVSSLCALTLSAEQRKENEKTEPTVRTRMVSKGKRRSLNVATAAPASQEDSSDIFSNQNTQSEIVSVPTDAAVLAECAAKDARRKQEREEKAVASTTAPLPSSKALKEVVKRKSQLSLIDAKDQEKYCAMSDLQRRNYNAKCRQEYHRWRGPFRFKQQFRERHQEKRRQSFVGLTVEQVMERNARRKRLYQRLTPTQLEAGITLNRLSSSPVSSIVSNDDSFNQGRDGRKLVG